MANAERESVKQYLNEKKAAEISGLSVNWLQRARWAGDGPPYAKVNRSVRYEIGALLRWMEERTVSPGAQGGAA